MDDSTSRDKLWQAVQDAQKEHIRAAAAFDALVVDGSHASLNGMLDGVAQDRRVAFEKYVQALGRFSKFLKQQRNPG